MTIRLLGVAALACAGLLAQTSQTAEPPLAVTHRVEVKAEGTKAVLDLENRSGRQVAAYAVRLARRGADGKAVWVQTHAVSTRGLGLSMGRSSFQPGEKWSDVVAVAGGEPTDVQLDLVMFEDGTFWGPNRSHQLERFLGMKDGARFEREGLARQK